MTIVKSVSEAVRNTIIKNKKTQDKETETERSAIIYGLKEDDVKTMIIELRVIWLDYQTL